MGCSQLKLEGDQALTRLVPGRKRRLATAHAYIARVGTATPHTIEELADPRWTDLETTDGPLDQWVSIEVADVYTDQTETTTTQTGRRLKHIAARFKRDLSPLLVSAIGSGGRNTVVFVLPGSESATLILGMQDAWIEPGDDDALEFREEFTAGRLRSHS